MKIILRTLDGCMTTLNALGAKYCIIMPDGGTYGTLPPPAPAAEPKKSRKKKVHDLHKDYIPLMTVAKVGDVVRIPYNGHEPHRLLGASTAWASTHWGKESYTSCRTDTEVQILRIR